MIHFVKNNVVENMNTNSYSEYKISFTTLTLQKLIKNYWKSHIKCSGRNDVIYIGIKDKNGFAIVKRSVTEK